MTDNLFQADVIACVQKTLKANKGAADFAQKMAKYLADATSTANNYVLFAVLDFRSCFLLTNQNFAKKK